MNIGIQVKINWQQVKWTKISLISITHDRVLTNKKTEAKANNIIARQRSNECWAKFKQKYAMELTRIY